MLFDLFKDVIAELSSIVYTVIIIATNKIKQLSKVLAVYSKIYTQIIVN